MLLLQTRFSGCLLTAAAQGTGWISSIKYPGRSQLFQNPIDRPAYDLLHLRHHLYNLSPISRNGRVQHLVDPSYGYHSQLTCWRTELKSGMSVVQIIPRLSSYSSTCHSHWSSILLLVSFLLMLLGAGLNPPALRCFCVSGVLWFMRSIISFAPIFPCSSALSGTSSFFLERHRPSASDFHGPSFLSTIWLSVALWPPSIPPVACYCQPLSNLIRFFSFSHGTHSYLCSFATENPLLLSHFLSSHMGACSIFFFERWVCGHILLQGLVIEPIIVFLALCVFSWFQ